jgi:plasmid stabilization system protein ParE
MPLPIYWSNRFVRDYQTYLQYLIETYSLKVAQEFDDQASETIQLISQYPNMYPRLRKNSQTRRALVNEYVFLYYRANSQYVQLIGLYGTRQDPTKASV